MSGDDIFNNVQPYHQILEKNLWKGITRKFMTNQPILSTILPPRLILTPTLPPRIGEPFSAVISNEHAAEIASWIDKKDDIYSATSNPYEFKLLLRGTRDGFTVASFWKLCNKKTHLVVVMKVKGTDEILGGYNPVGWDKLAFSLKNGTIQNSILSRIKDFEQSDLL